MHFTLCWIAVLVMSNWSHLRNCNSEKALDLLLHQATESFRKVCPLHCMARSQPSSWDRWLGAVILNWQTLRSSTFLPPASTCLLLPTLATSPEFTALAKVLVSLVIPSQVVCSVYEMDKKFHAQSFLQTSFLWRFPCTWKQNRMFTLLPCELEIFLGGSKATQHLLRSLTASSGVCVFLGQ